MEVRACNGVQTLIFPRSSGSGATFAYFFSSLNEPNFLTRGSMMPNSPKNINMTIKTVETEEMVNLPSNIEGYGQLPLQAYRSHIVHFTLIGMHVYKISIISSSSSMILILLCDGEGRRPQQRRRRLRKRHLKSEFAHASLLIVLIASSSIRPMLASISGA